MMKDLTVTQPIKCGLVPFYLKLYDELLPELRDNFASFVRESSASLQACGVAVETTSICCVAHEFDAAIKQLEAGGADCVVTLHLAYSPSLESIDAFCRTRLPIIILDTSMDANFGLNVSPDRIMLNHGVHGVMDFASMLRRRQRPFEIVAGHLSESSTLHRVADLVRAAAAARHLNGSRVLRIGKPFAGMGDFAVADDVLANRFGVEVSEIDLRPLDEAIATITADEVANEIASDKERFACELSEETHERAVRVGLGLRRLLEARDYQGLSVNFQAFDSADRQACTMPFLELSKAMERGLGYAGEGDVLTAALVGALARAFTVVTFTEIFCVDWAGGSLFLSHMGEINPAVAGDKPRIFEKPLPFIGGHSPAVLTCSARPGPAVFVNLAPGPGDDFSLIVAPVDVLAEDDSVAPAMHDMVRIWIRPRVEVVDFLEAYSRAGGTHHSALVLGEHAEAIAAFGRMLGVSVVELGRQGQFGA